MEQWRYIHKICFQDVFEWAGELRTIRIGKGNTIFAYPETIMGEAKRLFTAIDSDLTKGNLNLKKAAEYFAEVNVLHPFREGNGRTQRILFNEIFKRIGYKVDFSLTDQAEMVEAMIKGYKGDYQLVINLFKRISS